jgi:hypothetical protein
MHPAIGGRFIATVSGDSVQLLDRNSLAPLAQVPAPGADAIAISDSWLAYRAPSGGADGIFVRYIGDPASPGPPLQVAGASGPAQLSRPAVEGKFLLYGVASPAGSRIVQRVLGTRKHRALVRSGRLLLFDPSVTGAAFSYVRTDARRSQLMVRRRHGHGPGRVLLSLKPSAGMLWSNALTDAFAYATVINPSASGGDATIVGVSRRHPKRLRQRPPRGGGNHRF